jgi:hypothetical protein
MLNFCVRWKVAAYGRTSSITPRTCVQRTSTRAMFEREILLEFFPQALLESPTARQVFVLPRCG